MRAREEDGILEGLKVLLVQLELEPEGLTAISGDLLSAVISTHYIFGFRKDNPNVFNNLIQNWPHF